MRHILVVIFLVFALQAQKIDLANQTQNADFSAFPSVIPWKVGTSTPATCSVAQVFFDSDATPGQNVYVCTSTNTWTLSSGTAGGYTASRALQTDGSGNVAVSSVTSTELGYLSGVTSAIQTQLGGKQATITGGATSIVSSDLTVSRALASDASGKVAVSATTSTELGYLSGVTSAIQTQLGGKQATITGGASSIVSSDLTISRALASDGSGKVAVSATTATELGYVSGVTSAIQTQLGTKITASSTDTLTNKTLTGPIITGVAVGSLPAAASNAGVIYTVTDSTSIGDCTTGGGSAVTLCRSNGSAWAAFGDGNSGGAGSVSVQVDGGAIGTESTVNFVNGTGMNCSGTNPSGQVDVTCAVDTAVMQTKAAAQAGAELVCAPASGTNTLTCAMTPTLSSYATGMTVKLVPPANNTTAVTLDIDTIGAVAVETSGSTALSANDLVAGEAVLLTYNGTEFRFIGPAPSETGSPSVTASRAVVSDGSGNLTAATTTSTEIGYVNGVTSAIQTQLNGKLPTTTPFFKGVTVESPTSSEDITLFFTDDAITVTQINAVCVGSTPSVTWTVRHSTDRSATGNEVVTSGTATTSTTTGSEVTSFNDATIPAGSWVWLETTAQSGTVTSLNVTVEFTRD